jgi:hypothetical protein
MVGNDLSELSPLRCLIVLFFSAAALMSCATNSDLYEGTGNMVYITSDDRFVRLSYEFEFRYISGQFDVTTELGRAFVEMQADLHQLQVENDIGAFLARSARQYSFDEVVSAVRGHDPSTPLLSDLREYMRNRPGLEEVDVTRVRFWIRE